MKKDHIVLSFAAITLVIGAIGFIANNVASKNNELPEAQYAAMAPCKLLTLAEAKELLGPKAALAQSNNQQTNGDLQIETCSYGIDSTDGAKVVSLTVRSALTDSGTASNTRGFTQNMPEDAEAVPGYGQGAYWDADKAQLNIHSGRNWMIVTNGGTSTTNATLDDAKAVADKVFVNQTPTPTTPTAKPAKEQ